MMTDAKTRKRLLDLSVIATSALVLGGAFLVVAAVDETRTLTSAPSAADASPTPGSLTVGPAPAQPRHPSTLTAPASQAPVAGLSPAPKPARKGVVVRRSRAS